MVKVIAGGDEYLGGGGDDVGGSGNGRIIGCGCSR